MNSEITLFIIFLICFMLGVLLTGYIETLIKRKKAHERYIKQLQTENAYLKRTVAFFKIALETKGGNEKRA